MTTGRNFTAYRESHRTGCRVDPSLPMERRASPPSWTGEMPVAPSAKFNRVIFAA